MFLRLGKDPDPILVLLSRHFFANNKGQIKSHIFFSQNIQCTGRWAYHPDCFSFIHHFCPWFLIRKAIWYVPNCRIYEYYVIFIYFQAAVSALCWLSQFCTLKKKLGIGYVNIRKLVNSTHTK